MPAQRCSPVPRASCAGNMQVQARGGDLAVACLQQQADAEAGALASLPDVQRSGIADQGVAPAQQQRQQQAPEHSAGQQLQQHRPELTEKAPQQQQQQKAIDRVQGLLNSWQNPCWGPHSASVADLDALGAGAAPSLIPKVSNAQALLLLLLLLLPDEDHCRQQCEGWTGTGRQATTVGKGAHCILSRRLALMHLCRSS